MMLKKLLFLSSLCISIAAICPRTTGEVHESMAAGPDTTVAFSMMSDSSQFPPGRILKTALSGYEVLVGEKIIRRPEVITIIDYSLPSDKERLWVLDLTKGKVLYHCLVSHGRKSGELMAENFSNKPGSNASSPGFYTTGEAYIGKHGLSLALDGLETGINDNARARAIVIHGADYVSDDFIKNYGRLGRSLGCPAVPEKLSKEIISTIKGGSCLFIYAPGINYSSYSRIIRQNSLLTKR